MDQKSLGGEKNVNLETPGTWAIMEGDHAQGGEDHG